ncbi:unnamed protein product [Kluyveromyces dobzhanskii CBS 2104]|uniref:D-lactate dehydrogenase (cytochrome) n=1 Tax=Kluyveromyces dobzhanskii CBS 2104 TaxID=1427455 RepID=A0A0A8KZQ8_9SACH|nr:unnamed protein product [Kluyveromyces dobzhanskii CBS 2104]
MKTFGRLARSSARFARLYSTNRGAKNSGVRLSLVSGSLVVGVGLGLVTSNYLLPSSEKQIFPLKSTTPLASLDPPKYGSSEDLKLCINEIIRVIGADNVRNSEAELEHHADNGFNPTKALPHQKPEWIVYPTSTEEVSAVMKIINRYNIPVVPFSGGTALEGHTYSTRPGIVLNTSKLNKILDVHHRDLDAVLQAGVGWQQLNEHLASVPEYQNLMLGCDCGPGAHVCGMVNTNASGIGATRYGSMVANVISITVVLADGTIIKTKKRPRKSSAGYNLTGLFVGSEGTLGIVTEVTVKLQVKPPFETVAVVQFPTIKNSADTVVELFQKGIQLNAVELLDSGIMKCINYSNLVSKQYDNVPTLFFKIAGLNETVVQEYIKEVERISHKNHCSKFEFARSEEESAELFSTRKNSLYLMLDYAYNEIDENAKMWITDFAVPLSKLAATLEEIDKVASTYPLPHMALGHVGDGNIHYDVFYKPGEYEIAKKLVAEMNRITLKNEGTCSGEHGIGTGKRKFLEDELGVDAIDLMRKLKVALDPKRLLNPDKIFKIDPLDPSGE